MTPPLTFNAWMRYSLIRNILRELPNVRSVLEVGAGGGAMGARLAQRHEYVGVEPDEHSFELASRRLETADTGRVLRGDVSVLQDDERFDLVCAFEVLEHIEDDAGTLASWAQRLRHGGWMLLSVPAHQRQFGPADVKAGHYRRYERAQLRSLFEGAGLGTPTVLSYGFPFGYLLQWARNRLARREIAESAASIDERTAGSGRWRQPSDRNGWVTSVATAPFRLVQWPFIRGDTGTGYVVLGRRTGG